ncbi:MAG TPA: VOC family protein [Flavobacteriaceae bacterium]|nr:VOC family protein [Flavobacteriaceae bacterium]
MEQKQNAVCWFEIYVKDMERAKRFYSTVLNVELSDAPEMDGMPDMQMAFFPWVENAPNANGALVKMNDMPVGAGGTIIYFQCEDCAVEESRVADAGGKIHQPKMSLGEHGFCSMCVDTEGNIIGLHSMR